MEDMLTTFLGSVWSNVLTTLTETSPRDTASDTVQLDGTLTLKQTYAYEIAPPLGSLTTLPGVA